MAVKVPGNRLVVVSNRLPVVLSREAGDWQVEPGGGGLVAAMTPVLRQRGGTWIGWPGMVEEELGSHESELQGLLDSAMRGSGYAVKPVMLTAEERDYFYYGFSNEVVWPLFHDFPAHCNFDPDYWQTYQHVNHKYAVVISRNVGPDDFLWVHDYHLMGVARELREMGATPRVGFFLHTPFPPPDIYFKLPWRSQILRGLLEYDLIGLQTPRDVRNFLQCARALADGIEVTGEPPIRTVRYQGREVRIGAFPISIDFDKYAREAASREVEEKAAYLREDLLERELILGVDRLDYTKGIPHRLAAFSNALERYPDLHNRVTLVQVVVPSREDIPEYHELKTEIERLVGEINGQFTRPGWVPIHYMYRSLEFTELLAYYRAADVALITPLKDGMNLVAKEFCAASIEEEGVLVLSEFAGAAAQLKHGALLVNPYDVEGVADTIYRIFKMLKEERRTRMRALRETIREYDIFRWVDSFLRAALLESIGEYPREAH